MDLIGSGVEILVPMGPKIGQNIKPKALYNKFLNLKQTTISVLQVSIVGKPQ